MIVKAHSNLILVLLKRIRRLKRFRIKGLPNRKNSCKKMKTLLLGLLA